MRNMPEFEESSEVMFYIANKLHELSEQYNVGTKPFIKFNEYKNKYKQHCYELNSDEQFIDCMIERGNCALEHVISQYKPKIRYQDNLVSRTINKVTWHDSFDEYGGKK